MQQLRQFFFEPCNLSDCGSRARLESFHRLESLALYGSGTTDAVVSHISRLDKLKKLVFVNTKVTDAGLKSIEALVNLEFLGLPTHTTDAGFEHLRKLVKLRRIVPLDEITDRGLSYLRNMTEIEELHLESRSITDTGVQSLCGMARLQTLNLEANNVTDAGLIYLQECPSYRRLISPVISSPTLESSTCRR